MNDVIELPRGPLTAVEVKAAVQLIQEVMASVMVKDVHYGVIPGTQKPTLYKPGSEKILTTFRIAAYPKEVEDLSTHDEIRYRVKVHGIHQLTEVLIGVGIGECSSDEEKYKWRKPVCDEEFNETPEDRKRIAWKKYQNNTYQQKQVRTNPADVANTILKMAKKRAQIDMTLTATAASDVFDQDLEDLPEGVAEGVADNKKPPLKEPQKKESGGKETAELSITTTVSDVGSKTGESNGKPYTIYGITGGDGAVYKTFSETFADIARSAMADGSSIKISYRVGKYGNDINDLIAEAREPGAEG